MSFFLKCHELVIATANPGKFGEIRGALQGLAITLRSLEEFSVTSSPEETGQSYIENATIKARYYSELTATCALADDSGLEVEALDKKPGLHSARFGDVEADTERMELILGMLSTVSPQDRRARFVCAISVAEPKTKAALSFEGVVTGRIAESIVGTNGFGYDSIFIPDGYHQTFGELASEVKASISHRARALLQARRYLEGAISSP